MSNQQTFIVYACNYEGLQKSYTDNSYRWKCLVCGRSSTGIFDYLTPLTVIHTDFALHGRNHDNQNLGESE